MEIKQIKEKVNEKIFDYCVGILSIDDLVDFIVKINPDYICKLLKNSKNNNIGNILEVIKNYDYYKENGNKDIIEKRIVDYYKENLVNRETGLDD